MLSTGPSIKSVVIRFTVHNIEKLKIALSNFETKKCINFFVWKCAGYSYNIFTSSGSVNSTGIKDFADIKKAVQVFRDKFNFQNEDDLTTPIVDNTTFSGSFGKEINVSSLLQKLPVCVSSGVSARFTPQFFPCLTYKTPETTCLIFANGKYSIVGGKTLEHAEKIYDVIRSALSNCDNVQSL